MIYPQHSIGASQTALYNAYANSARKIEWYTKTKIVTINKGANMFNLSVLVDNYHCAGVLASDYNQDWKAIWLTKWSVVDNTLYVSAYSNETSSINVTFTFVLLYLHF